jgi:hypothetical protein
VPTTYLFDKDIERINNSLIDKDLKKLLEELNKISKYKWIINEYQHASGFWFNKKKKSYFSLHCQVLNHEWEIISFKNDHEAFCPVATKSTIINYIMGLIDGIEEKSCRKLEY